MPHDRNALKAGSFILASAALAVGVIVAIKGTGALTRSDREHVAVFDLADDVGGLRAGSEVRVGGLRLGTVNGVRLDRPAGGSDAAPADAPRVIVRFDLPGDLDVRRGAVVRVQTTLTGQAWLNLDSLGTGEPIADGEPLDGEPGGITELLASVSGLAPDAQALIRTIRESTLPKAETALASAGGAADSVRETVESARGRIDPLADRLAAVADLGGEAATQVRDAVAENRPDVRQAVADARAFVADARVAAERTNAALADVQAFAADAKVIAADSVETSRAARSLVVSNRGRIDEIVEGVKTASDQLAAASGEIRRSPWRLLYRPDKNEAGNLDLFDAARQFADGANELSDAAVALRDAMADPSADAERIGKLLGELDARFERFDAVEAGLFDRVAK